MGVPNSAWSDSYSSSLERMSILSCAGIRFPLGAEPNFGIFSTVQFNRVLRSISPTVIPLESSTPTLDHGRMPPDFSSTGGPISWACSRSTVLYLLRLQESLVGLPA